MSKRYRSKEQCYLMPGNITRTAWHPQIQINGKWAYISDESTLSKLVEADTEMKANELAIKALHGFEASA